MKSPFRYLIYDIESVTDKPLLNKVLYQHERLDDEAAFKKHLAELATEERDFVNPAFHQPISLAALAVGDDFSISRIGLLGGESKTTESIVRDFWEIYQKNRPVLVDFNGKGFDLRLLELWAYRLGITIGEEHFGKYGPRYRFADDKHIDLHEWMTNYGAIRFRGGLNLFAKLIGKPGKMETSGQQVQELFEAGQQFVIDDYCLSDALDTYFIFLRTRVMKGEISLERERELGEQAKKKILEKSEKEGYFKKYLERLPA
ncbi:MAG: 3'-5' exonuclease [bacterium]|nr:3'-5' exonuclease [bacterium]